jgi:hypothetical protein
MKTAPVIDLSTRHAEGTARAKAMLDAAPRAGVDLRAMNDARRRLNDHAAEYDRTRTSRAWRRRELEKLIEADTELLVEGFKKLAAAVDRS